MRTRDVLLISLLCLGVSAWSQVNADRAFAEYLFTQGEYYRAITEFHRILFTTGDTHQRTEILKRMAYCYYSGNEYEGTIAFLEKNRSAFVTNAGINAETKLLLAKSKYQLEMYADAIATLERTELGESDSLYDEKYYFLGLSYAQMDDWGNTLKSIACVKENPAYLPLKNRLVGNRDVLLSLSPKDPATAGLLAAVLPGSGYIYCGRTGTGITALLVNGLLVWSIVDAIRDHRYGLALSIGFFGAGWYVGNITGSVNAAHEYNRLYRNKFLDGDSGNAGE